MDKTKFEKEIDNFNIAVRQAVSILEKEFGNHSAIAMYFHIDGADFSNSMNGKREWRLPEASAIFTKAGFTLVEANEYMSMCQMAHKYLDYKIRGKI